MANLTTGFLAVGAALFIGLRQTKIQNKQADIQLQSLRSDLFERRYVVFEKSVRFLLQILQRADDPDDLVQREFIVALGECRFLFAPKVHAALNEIWEEWTKFHALRSDMKVTFENANHYGEGNPQKQSEFLRWFSQRYRDLPDIFEELKLGTPDSK